MCVLTDVGVGGRQTIEFLHSRQIGPMLGSTVPRWIAGLSAFQVDASVIRSRHGTDAVH
jgi:hypothetical protein